MIDLNRQVRVRARYRCEYCHLPSAAAPVPFQIDHIRAKQHGGATELENLALACIRCNRYKGPNLAGIDPHTGEKIRLFHPRCDIWAEHFEWSGPELLALTSIGRATIAVLSINDPEIQRFRAALLDEGFFEQDQGFEGVKT